MNYLKQNLTKLITKQVHEQDVDKFTAFVNLAKQSNGFFWDVFDFTNRKYGFRTSYETVNPDLLLEAFLDSVGRLTYDDIQDLSKGMNEHDHFELMLLYSAEDYQPL